MRITDIFLAFPRLVLALAFAAALGPGHRERRDRHRAHRLAALCAARPRRDADLRGEPNSSRPRELQGASHAAHHRARQIMPLCLPSVIIRLTLDMAGIILTAAGLGFLGLGAQPPAPEWGAMVSSGRQVLLDQWWVATIPGLAIFIVSLGFNLLGDGLRDVLRSARSMSDDAAARPCATCASPIPATTAISARCATSPSPSGRERLGIVGEFGSGKSTTGRAIMGLVRRPAAVEADELRLRRHRPARPAANAAFASCAASASPWCCRTRNSRSIR